MTTRGWIVIALTACGHGSGGNLDGGDDGNRAACGPDRPAGTMTAADPNQGLSMTFDNFVAVSNNACPSTPLVESLTIRGSHESGGVFEICLPRPDRVEQDGLFNGPEILLLGVTAIQNGCSFAITDGADPMLFGGGEVGGFCDGGTNPAGFRMTLNLEKEMTRDCGGGTNEVFLGFTGTVVVMPE